MKTISVLIVAGGSGTRFGTKKQFLAISGMPMLKRSALVFENHPKIRRIVVVVPEQDIPLTKDILCGMHKLHAIVAGGATRQESVWNGLQYTKDADITLIHDGARPLVTSALIDRVIAGLDGFDACIPAIPITDTIKQVTDGLVVKTIPRHDLFHVQTPQAFITDKIIAAHEKVRQSGISSATDDSLILEIMGASIKIVEGDPFNIKITQKTDLTIAEVLFKCHTE